MVSGSLTICAVFIPVAFMAGIIGLFFRQFGLTLTSANQAVVIFLLELVVGAFSAWWLAGEQPGPAEWIGGGMIVAATLFSERLASPQPANA